ncbi:MAG: DNA alkylation repair protein [Ilumatobacteraceae bacterium]
MSVSDLVTAVRRGLAVRADAAAAPVMQRYMKSALPFRGVGKPGRVDLLRELRPLLANADVVLAAADALWDGAEFREEGYLGIALSRTLAPEPVRLRTYRHWIVTGAWWDYVDEIASHLVGPTLRAVPAEVTPIIRSWASDPDRWVRRTSIICQLGSKDRTDTELLAAAIEASSTDSDFFLRKGIGWALRQHAHTDPGWVSAFLANHPELSPLSRREASKHL